MGEREIGDGGGVYDIDYKGLRDDDWEEGGEMIWLHRGRLGAPLKFE